jgi:hypothetical protein
LIGGKLMEDFDKNKLEELKQIIYFGSPEKIESKLLKFESENNAGFYYIELIFVSDLKTCRILTSRMKYINFKDKEEFYIRKLVKIIDQIGPFLFLQEFVKHNQNKTNLLLIIAHEIANDTFNFNNYFENVISFVSFVNFDSNILHFYKLAIQLNLKININFNFLNLRKDSIHS